MGRERRGVQELDYSLLVNYNQVSLFFQDNFYFQFLNTWLAVTCSGLSVRGEDRKSGLLGSEAGSEREKTRAGDPARPPLVAPLVVPLVPSLVVPTD